VKLISLLRIATYTAIGIFFGATLGALARGWMRIISDDPEFSWDGTLLIVGIFTVWGFTQGTVIGVRRITSRRWIVTLARVFGSAGLLALFLVLAQSWHLLSFLVGWRYIEKPGSQWRVSYLG